MVGNSKSLFFLFSFIPALAYWWLEENYPLRIALSVGLGLAIVEILIERLWLGHVHTLSKFNFAILMLLGGISLLGDEGIWFKLQPAFTGAGVGAFLLVQQKRGKSLIVEIQKEMTQKVTLPPGIAARMEMHMGLFMLGYGFFMAVVAFKASTDSWLFFKTVGFYIASFLFFGFEVFNIRRWVKNQA